MTCHAPSAEAWRRCIPDWDDEYLRAELNRAWLGRSYAGPPYGRLHHDWTNFRTATLREARKRGLDISVTGLGT